MSRFERKKVVTTWKCKLTNKEVTASEEAVYHDKYGWICICLDKQYNLIWTTGDDNNHEPKLRNIRDVFIPDPKDTVSSSET